MESKEDEFYNPSVPFPEGSVFKKCSIQQTEYLIVLEKPTESFLCNEHRSSIVDKSFAKFRCNKLITRHIINLKTLQKIQSLKNWWSFKFATYTIGEEVIPDKYEPDINQVCAGGIHYFLTLDAALNYQISDGCVFDGFNQYDENGEIWGMHKRWCETMKLSATMKDILFQRSVNRSMAAVLSKIRTRPKSSMIIHYN